MTILRIIFVLTLISIFTFPIIAADSVDVVFRYTPPGNPTSVFLVGEFNDWNNAAWPMTKVGNVWMRTARLPVGGNPNPPAVGVPGAWQYKFYYTGVSQWPNDPLNHHTNPRDNDNTFIYLKDPTIYHFLPNQRTGLVGTATPTISAYIFPRAGGSVDTSTLAISIDGLTYSGIGSSYDFATKQLSFVPPPMNNGAHTIILTAGATKDTVTFTTQAGFVRFTNQFPFTTWKESWTLYGIVDDSTVSSIRITRNGTDTADVAVVNKTFAYTTSLLEGVNNFTAIADSAGVPKISSPVTFTRRINHAPLSVLTVVKGNHDIYLTADSSSDPDLGQSDSLSYLWLEDATNPVLFGINGQTGGGYAFAHPTQPGDYFYSLIVSDPNGNRDTTRSYFTVAANGSITVSTLTSNPAWAQQARVYFLFPKAFTPQGTISAAAARLPYVKDLGFNVIWMMPVMRNAYPIDNGIGPGYNIVDFYNVAPEYGTNQDFKDFISQAHALGIKVILDVTPNHSSRFHPWSTDAHAYKLNSPYWDWYQHVNIPHNTNGLGQSADADNFWYYSGFSDQLMNLNWTDVDLRNQMIEVYKYWIKEFGLDGYRFDVYWGPHRRYGEQYMGHPVRVALKHVKPDIFLLAEDDGTGGGTETIYADNSSGGVSGGVDAAYDFKLYFNQVRNFAFNAAAINNLHNEIFNGGFYPGQNALYMRFMESQDEDRIFYLDPTPSSYFNADPVTAFNKTMPMASVLFTAPGFPMIWNGQEIGWGYGISGGKLARSRSVIDWNFQGKNVLSPHYQRLAHIRGQFPAFTWHKRDTNGDEAVTSADSSDFVRVASSNSIVYAFTRPYENQNGLTVVSFSATSQFATLDLTVPEALRFTGGIQPGTLYYLNNLYDNTRQQVLGSQLNAVPINLSAYGSAIYTVSLTEDSVIINNPVLDVREESPELPLAYSLLQNYPNPFNPSTTIKFSLMKEEHVAITVYNVIGEEVARLISEEMQAGTYSVTWNAKGAASGVYFYRLQTPSFTSIKKMALIR